MGVVEYGAEDRTDTFSPRRKRFVFFLPLQYRSLSSPLHTASVVISDRGGAGSCLLFSFVLLALCASTLHADWRLVWGDEFDYTGLPDSDKWGYEVGYVRNNEAQYYTWGRLENAHVDNGMLVIEARRDWCEGHEYTSASLTTRNKHSWLYGRFEIRAKIDIRTGSCPAFWTLGASRAWPACGEIDIMEYYRGGILHNTFCGNDCNGGWNGGDKSVDAAWAQRFHVWRMDWDHDYVRLYCDDELMLTTDLSLAFTGDWNPFRQPHYIIVNQAMGGVNGGPIDNNAFPYRYEVDYVRIYEWSDNPGTHIVAVSTMGDGSITVTPEKAEYAPGEQVTVTAQPGTDHAFVGWSGDASGTDNPLTMTVDRDLAITARFVNEGEMLVNGSFQEGTTGWTSPFINTENGAQATCGVSDGEYVATVTHAGVDYWDVQFTQPGLFLAQGQTYRLAFTAYADRGDITFKVGANKSTAPYTGYFIDDVHCSTAPQQFTYDFTMEHSDETDARVEFNLGQTVGTVYIDDVSLTRIDATPTRTAPKRVTRYLPAPAQRGRMFNCLGRAVERRSPGASAASGLFFEVDARDRQIRRTVHP